MTTWLLGIVTLLYAAAAIGSALRGKWPMVMILAGYVLANVGLLIVGRQG